MPRRISKALLFSACEVAEAMWPDARNEGAVPDLFTSLLVTVIVGQSR
jgi:hypothetical protein